jgi:hypothetical protein
MPERVQEDLELPLRECQPENKEIVAEPAVSETAPPRFLPDKVSDVASALAALRQTRTGHPAEKRCDPRFPANEVASMHPVSPLILDRSTVQILNVSKRGLMLRAPEFLQVGIVIQIRLKNLFVLGEVRYCKPVDEMFHVGVQIQDLQPR